MQTLQKYGGILAIIAVLVACVSLTREPSVVEKINNITQPSVGGTSPEIASPYVMINGVREWYVSVPTANLTSSTLCSILTPAATTTLSHASVRFYGENTSASVNKVYKSATASATTTLLFARNTGAGEQDTFSATTTTNDFVIAPSQYIVLDTSANYAQTGFCNAVFTEI